MFDQTEVSRGKHYIPRLSPEEIGHRTFDFVSRNAIHVLIYKFCGVRPPEPFHEVPQSPR